MSERPLRPRWLGLLTAWASLAVIAAGAAADEPAAPPRRSIERLESAWPDHPEWLAMLADIAQGSQLGPTEGWFRKAKAQTRLGWDAAKSQFDADGDGRIARPEFPGGDDDFARLDRDGDGSLGKADFDFSAHALAPSPGMMLFYGADRDGNGKVTRDEFAGLFDGIAGDSDAEFLSLAEMQGMFGGGRSRGRGSSGGPDGPTRWTLIRGLFTQEIGSLQPGPEVGDLAPDFTLKTVDGDESVTLSSLIGPKPVVLIFGNFTCGPFRSQAGNVEKLFDRYKDRATFAMVYVREAHPTNGWSMESNDQVGVSLAQPTHDDERRKVAQTCRRTLDLDMPMLVDTIDDVVGGRYSGMPSRLYLIDAEGKVAYKSGRGPFGFKPAELEQSLVMLLHEPATAARVPLVSDAEAWRLLPPTELGGGEPLPHWARALARPLPRTTAAMLDLDRLHRTKSPLGPRLRGLMRWVAADANESPYAKATAEADLRRHGIPEADLDALRRGDLAAFPEEERKALEFAHRLTVEGSEVTDAQVADLVARHGDANVVAMVLLMAYANFQDRLLLTLGVELEPGGPLPPLQVRFARVETPPPVPTRQRPAGGPEPPPAPDRVDDPDWTELAFDDLQGSLTVQRDNPGRVRVPTFEEVLEKMPSNYPKPKNPLRIKWSLVCMGYQPELASAWSACTRNFGEEAKQDRVFEESLFWVVTRTIHCFY